MKDIIIRSLAITIMVSVAFATLVGVIAGVGYVAEFFEHKQQVEKERCKNKDGVWNDSYRYCEAKYERCLKLVRTAFEDLTDTMGASQNHEDSVSKTMEREINHCLEKI